MTAAGIVVPVRAFTGGFARLAGRLDEPARADLARRLADRVVDAAGPLPVVVVTSAGEVRSWAAERGAAVVDDPGSLNAAAAAGRAYLAERDCARVAVVHGDLPLARDLAPVVADGAAPVAVLVPDRRDDGTPVLSLPAAAPFGFAYGPGSFARHAAEAARAGLEVRIHRDADLAFDVDEPGDLDELWQRDRA